MQSSDAASRLPRQPGVYQVTLRLEAATRLQVGALGDFEFPAGWYVYTGSALSGLRARVGRHLGRDVRPHWHIDWLLAHGRVVSVATCVTRRRLECAWNQVTLGLPGARIVAPGFGSSDCRCPAHLIYVGDAERAPAGLRPDPAG
ncbi:MAG TPA: GIY-YIG nuclease family protein [Chthonomonadales bacterium]|nr:GIY-YIG nuclease family protein [Chthonomonadales bacterium]